MPEIRLKFPDLRSLLIFMGHIRLKKFHIDKQTHILSATLIDAEIELAMNGFKATRQKIHKSN